MERAAWLEQMREKNATIFSGEDAFLLHDTYGFPLDLTQMMAREKNLDVDVEEFNRAMKEQRSRSRAAASDNGTGFLDLPDNLPKSSEFVGYEKDEAETEVVYADKDKLILAHTPFYAESGGQVGDTGHIDAGDFHFYVENTIWNGDHIVHQGHSESDTTITTGQKVQARIDTQRRRATERNHTATHLLHKALRTVLGEHVHQAGSLVHPEYLRFDFNHFEKVKEDDLAKIESMVNDAIIENYPVHWERLPLEEARNRGAMALFGEKYDDVVRMLEVDDYSRELCGGTHVRATGEIGMLNIVSESAVAAGVRRIEALTGAKAFEAARKNKMELSNIAHILSCPPQETASRVQRLLDERKKLMSAASESKRRDSKGEVQKIAEEAQQIKDIKVAAVSLEVSSIDELKRFGDMLRDALRSGVGLLSSTINEKGIFICVVTKDLVNAKRLHAGTLIKEIAQITGSSGGGSPHMAQAGIKDSSKVELALQRVPKIVEKQLGN